MRKKRKVGDAGLGGSTSRGCGIDDTFLDLVIQLVIVVQKDREEHGDQEQDIIAKVGACLSGAGAAAAGADLDDSSDAFSTEEDEEDDNDDENT